MYNMGRKKKLSPERLHFYQSSIPPSHFLSTQETSVKNVFCVYILKSITTLYLICNTHIHSPWSLNPFLLTASAFLNQTTPPKSQEYTWIVSLNRAFRVINKLSICVLGWHESSFLWNSTIFFKTWLSKRYSIVTWQCFLWNYVFLSPSNIFHNFITTSVLNHEAENSQVWWGIHFPSEFDDIHGFASSFQWYPSGTLFMVMRTEVVLSGPLHLRGPQPQAQR